MDFDQFAQDADNAGVQLDPGNMLAVARRDALALVGVKRGFETVAPARYADEVTFGAGYFNIPGLRTPLRSGLYALQSCIDKVEIGRHRGAVILRGADGEGAATLPADYTITSLEVPPTARGRVRLLTSPEVLLSLDETSDEDEFCLGIEWECDNGGTICIGFVIDPTPIDPPPE